MTKSGLIVTESDKKWSAVAKIRKSGRKLVKVTNSSQKKAAKKVAKNKIKKTKKMAKMF